MDPKKLLQFIFTAHRNTYAAPSEIKKKYKCDSIFPGHKDYDFVEGDWRYHDSYSGRIWPPGKEIVFYQGKPVWTMSYQGKAKEGLSQEFIKKMYTFLKKALMNNDKEMPFRGPASFQEGYFVYSFSFKGDYSYFIGREAITHKRKEVFFQDVMGSLIK